METETKVPEGQTPEPVAEETEAQKQVSYETHRKLLSEKKSLQERFAQAAKRAEELEASIAQAETAKLEEQNQYKTLYEQLKEENQGLHGAISERDKTLQDALKVDAFSKALGGRKIERKYMGFVDTGNILIDPDTGDIDELSAQKEVERVLTEFPEIVRGAIPAKPLPSNAPAPASARPSKDEQYELLKKYAKIKLGR